MATTFSVNKEYKKQLKKLIEEVGPWNVDDREMRYRAEQWGVTMRTMYNWKRDIIQEMPILDVKQAGKDIVYALRQNMALCQQKIRTEKAKEGGSDAIIAKYSKILIDTSKAFTEAVEKYQLKPVVVTEGGINFMNIQGDYNPKVLAILDEGTALLKRLEEDARADAEAEDIDESRFEQSL